MEQVKWCQKRKPSADVYLNFHVCCVLNKTRFEPEIHYKTNSVSIIPQANSTD
jgi:hypothetical protein